MQGDATAPRRQFTVYCGRRCRTCGRSLRNDMARRNGCTLKSKNGGKPTEPALGQAIVEPARGPSADARVQTVDLDAVFNRSDASNSETQSAEAEENLRNDTSTIAADCARNGGTRFRSAQQPGGVNFTRHRSCQRLCRFETAKSTTYALTPPGPALCELYFTSPKTSHTKTCIKSALCEVCAVCEVLEPRLVFTSPPPVPTSAVVPMGPSRDSLRSNFLFLSKNLTHLTHFTQCR